MKKRNIHTFYFYRLFTFLSALDAKNQRYLKAYAGYAADFFGFNV